MQNLTPLWRGCAEPRTAHRLAEALLSGAAYRHTRGVAQQAARLVSVVEFDRAMRHRLLAGAWVHDLGLAVGGGSTGAGRALRAAGSESLARLVAHQLATGESRRLSGEPPLEAEFPPPQGEDRLALNALDVAIVTTDQSGARVTPREGMAAIAGVRGTADPWVRALVGRMAELADDARASSWLRALSPAAA